MNHVAGYILVGIVVMLVDILVDWKLWRRLVHADGVIATAIVSIILYGTLWPFCVLNAIMCAVSHTWKIIFKGKASK